VLVHYGLAGTSENVKDDFSSVVELVAVTLTARPDAAVPASDGTVHVEAATKAGSRLSDFGSAGTGANPDVADQSKVKVPPVGSEAMVPNMTMLPMLALSWD